MNDFQHTHILYIVGTVKDTKNSTGAAAAASHQEFMNERINEWANSSKRGGCFSMLAEIKYTHGAVKQEARRVCLLLGPVFLSPARREMITFKVRLWI
jgi:hypothetical protein